MRPRNPRSSQRRRHKMIVKNKKKFAVGGLFSLTFLGVLLLIFSPVFKGKNGLDFADANFNMLAKGSSYFIPKVARTVEPMVGKQISQTMNFDTPEEAEKTAVLFEAAGASASASGSELKAEGDLGRLLQAALLDADNMYNNNGEAVSGKYGYDEKNVLKNWWNAFAKVEKSLKKQKSIPEAKAVSDVMKKAIEPAYNFYHVEAQKVSDHAGMMTGLLVFYVGYTMWWGYAILYLFEGVGLTMKKSKVKKEV